MVFLPYFFRRRVRWSTFCDRYMHEKLGDRPNISTYEFLCAIDDVDRYAPVKYVDQFSTMQCHFLVTELAARGETTEYIGRVLFTLRRALSWARTVFILRQAPLLCSAMLKHPSHHNAPPATVIFQSSWGMFWLRYLAEELAYDSDCLAKSAYNSLSRFAEATCPSRVADCTAESVSDYIDLSRAAGRPQAQTKRDLRHIKKACEWSFAVGLIDKIPEFHSAFLSCDRTLALSEREF